MPGMIAAFTLTAFAGDGGLIVELAGSTISRTYAIDSRSSAESWPQTASTMMPLTGMPRSTPMISLAWRLLMKNSIHWAANSGFSQSRVMAKYWAG